jgi:hypothetical protein
MTRSVPDYYAVLHASPRERAEESGQATSRSSGRRKGSRPQDIPVRVVRRREPPLRVTPVRWESGPWA